MDRKNNTPGTPVLPPMPGCEARVQAKMRFAPIHLDPAQRQLVEQSLQTTCEYMDWSLRAVNARSNHVHAVVTADGWAPEEVMRVLKAWATRRLREASLVPARQPVWAQHGSIICLWSRNGSSQQCGTW